MNTLSCTPLPLAWRVVLPLVVFIGCYGSARGDSDQRQSTASWPAFRGHGDSISAIPAERLPLHWSEGKNVAWKVDLKGFGQSSPVIYSDEVVVTSTAGEHKERLFVESFALSDGTLRWRKEFAASQTAEEVSEMISRGAPTPLIDGQRVYAFFESGDFVALNRADGELLWRRDLVDEYGEFIGGHGIGSSPIFAGENIVLLVDHDGPSYLLCIDPATGENIWKAEREPRVSWTSPLFVDHEGSQQVIVSSNGQVASYRLTDGRVLWEVDGLEGNNVAAPTRTGDLIVIASSAPQNSQAIRLGGDEAVGDAHRVWKAKSVTSSFASPLPAGDAVLFINRAGALQATDRNDGAQLWQRRLPDGCWASPVSVGGRIYLFCKNGATVVLDGTTDARTEPEELAVNSLAVEESDRVYGVAVADDGFVIRTAEQIVKIGIPDKTTK